MPRKLFLLLALLLSVFSGVAQTLRQASPWNSGVGLADRIADRPADWPLLTTQFSHVTPENCMKPDALRRTEQAWNFNQADKFVAFANSNDLKVVGHCLVWAKDDRTPAWFYQDGAAPASKEVLLARMKSYIETVVGRYKGKIAAWDVVNEALDDGKAELRESGWTRAAGEDFIALAFEYAHAADPSAQLIYNDYNNELDGKREKMLALLARLKACKAPVHAVGLQGHYEIDRVPYEALEKTLIALRGIGMKVVVSELDIDVIPRGRWWADNNRHRTEMAKINPYVDGCPPEILARQAEQYAQLFRLFRKYDDVIDRVSFWNLHDGQSWLNDFPWKRVNHPLLFDRQGKPKPAFDAVMKELTAAVAPSRAIEKAHAEIWNRFVDEHGVVRDFVGELPTPEDCRLGKPNAIGWWSPIENGPMFTGMYLQAMVERARRSGAASDKEQARKLSQGLLKCASVSDVPGFVARGVGSDGKCHYPLSSDDQMHPWFLGLHAYLRSDIPSADERAILVAKVRAVADVLESTGWRMPCDGAFKGDFRGGFMGEHFRDAVRYLYMLRATYEMTGDAVWLGRYRKALAEKPAKSAETRQEICALGCPRDLPFIPQIDKGKFWIYVGSQAGLAWLASVETAPGVEAAYRKGLAVNAQYALPAVETHAQFDNADQGVFGSADWRSVYATWFPQPTQAEAERLAKIVDYKKRGPRKGYESSAMRNPLAAAAIVALSGDPSGSPVVLKAVSHYDYARLNMAEFFFAEVAYYALPEVK
jgi:endo-1,4-beta-xylanase